MGTGGFAEVSSRLTRSSLMNRRRASPPVGRDLVTREPSGDHTNVEYVVSSRRTFLPAVEAGADRSRDR